ncbi:MAG: NAD(P)/FAD-dependent oxidoreductase [Bacteroidetes bacterium]|nr:MAG: NAD(P)/FAD-dependent oxidoreductase [Bacteroidota bacterium]
MKTIIILGGGIGGVVSANKLRKKLHSEYKIILIEKNPVHYFVPSFMWVMTGDRKPSNISVKLEKLVNPGIDLVIAEAKSIDLINKNVNTLNGNYNYDYLIIALGAELAPELINGYNQDFQTFYSFEGSVKLFEALQNFNGGTIDVVVCSLPYKCPGAPIEGTLLIADYLRKKGLDNKIKINYFTPEPQPMPVAGPELGSSVIKLLESNNIVFHPLYKLERIVHDNREIFFENKNSEKYDLLVIIPPHRSPQVVRDSGITNEAGWIPANPQTLETKYENVFAIGDITSVPVPGRWKPNVPMMLPKAGVFAHGQAEIVADRIIDKVNNIGNKHIFKGDGYCVIEAGNKKAAFAFGNFYGEPHPNVIMKKIGIKWHIGKVMFEKWWLSSGVKKSLIEVLIKFGIKLFRIPIKI